MNTRRVSFLLGAAALLSGIQGCSGTACHRAGFLSMPRSGAVPSCDKCGVGGPMPPRFTPLQTPGPNPPNAVIQQGSYTPSGAANSQPLPAGAPNVYLSAPEPVDADAARNQPRDIDPSRDSTRLYSPQTAEPPTAKDDRAASPAMPVDIPQFAAAKTSIASGQEPSADGVAWLKAHGYRTVLHIRAPGEDNTPARRLFENGKLRYLSLEVSPQTLSKAIVDEFNRLVTDNSSLPLFVFDKDSSLAGGLWYLHFRLVDKASDEKARADAAHLGFRQDQDGPHRTMWLAVQKYLESEKP